MEPLASWVAPIATTVAALMTASNLGSRVTGWGFVVFTVGSLAWLSLGIATGQPSLLWQNVVLTGLNLFGIWRWLGREARFEDGGNRAQATSEELASATLFPASLLTTATVKDARGESLATCIEAMLDGDSGRPVYLVVAEGGIAGVGETLRRLPWSEVNLDGEAFATRLANLDRCDRLERDRWPAR